MRAVEAETMSSSQANSDRHPDTQTEPGVSREAPPLKM